MVFKTGEDLRNLREMLFPPQIPMVIADKEVARFSGQDKIFRYTPEPGDIENSFLYIKS